VTARATRPGPARLGAPALAVLAALSLIASAPPAAATGGAATAVPPPAPRPTSAEISPSAPDPHPPLGAIAPDGTVPGGARLANRGLVLPAGAPRLPKGIGARAWILADLDTGAVLAARDPHGRYQPASILKALLTLTVLPRLPGRLVVSESRAAAQAEGSAVGLLAGARYTVDQLFAALLLVSANDAALALAQANGGVSVTVAQMNAEARRLGAYDTMVQTPSGLDGWSQLTSPYDMALVLRAAVAQPRFVGYDRLTRAGYPAKSSHFGKVAKYEFDNQSQEFFDRVPGALVAKTGYTDAARHTYLAAVRRNGRRLGVIMLRNERLPRDQYQQAAALFDWAFRLPAATRPVGRLAGPVSASGAGSTTAPRAIAVPFTPARGQLASVVSQADVPALDLMFPATAAIAGALWLGCVFVAGRRARWRRGQRRR
jgi:D-alanyl-D-alanine carboxypeptidase (penicillin-binding protein 5/6)